MKKYKAIITYVMGIASGVILTLLFAFYIYKQDAFDTGVNLFDKPHQEVKADEFTVIQVLPNGNALATYNKFSLLDDNDLKYGTVVMFLAKQEEPYYDDQQINLPKGKIYRQIGTYRYKTAQETEKTVPIIGVCDN